MGTKQIEEVAGEEVFSGKTADCAPELEETFLENVLALETHGFRRPVDALVEAGFSLLQPGEMDDAALTAKLWELVRPLAQRQLFLHSTDLQD